MQNFFYHYGTRKPNHWKCWQTFLECLAQALFFQNFHIDTLHVNSLFHKMCDQVLLHDNHQINSFLNESVMRGNCKKILPHIILMKFSQKHICDPIFYIWLYKSGNGVLRKQSTCFDHSLDLYLSVLERTIISIRIDQSLCQDCICFQIDTNIS